VRCWCAGTRSRAEVATLLRDDNPPDYVLLDDMLGEHETGLELAHWLAQSIEPKRILLMTGNADVQRLNELSVSQFTMLRKPISVAALNDWVARVNSSASSRVDDGKPGEGDRPPRSSPSRAPSG
jgi:CheY-like chemotaxis protein